jgi:hypothetical protein
MSRKFISKEKAIAMLPDRETLHVQINNIANLIIGSDWQKDQVIELITNNKPELAGELATSMGKGLAVITDEDRYFIETKGS